MKSADIAFYTFWSASCFALGIIFTSCSPPPPLESQPQPYWCAFFPSSSGIGRGTAIGDVSIRSKNEAYSGNVDLTLEKTGCIKADFYGPFGIIAASLYADSIKGVIAFKGREYVFGLKQAMDTLPLDWGNDLAFFEFLQIICGRLPMVATTILCKHQPDSLVKKRNTIYALWNTDSLEMRLEINSKSNEIAEASLYFKKKAPFWSLKMGSFHKGTAHKIQLHADSENYFLIHYTKVNLNK